jgi:hypothetical protein
MEQIESLIAENFLTHLCSTPLAIEQENVMIVKKNVFIQERQWLHCCVKISLTKLTNGVVEN